MGSKLDPMRMMKILGFIATDPANQRPAITVEEFYLPLQHRS